MPLGVVADNDFELEQSKLLGRNNVQVSTLLRGRGNTTQVPDSVRALIAEAAISGEKAKDISEALNISESSISAYKNGATSTSSYHTPQEKLAKHIDQVKERIIKKSKSALESAIEAIDDDKLAHSNARDLSTVARNMAATIEKLEGKSSDSDSGGNRVQVNIIVPPQKDINTYDIVEVGK